MEVGSFPWVKRGSELDRLVPGHRWYPMRGGSRILSRWGRSGRGQAGLLAEAEGRGGNEDRCNNGGKLNSSHRGGETERRRAGGGG